MEEQNNTNQTAKRCAVVTGANRGIGFEICRKLASNGIMVILTAIDEKKGNEAVANIKESGLSDVIFHQLDITDPVGIASLASFVKTHFGKLDILVNNAGDNGVIIDLEALKALNLPEGEMNDEQKKLVMGVLHEPYEKAEQCLKTNYYGSKSVTEALLPLLKLSKSARIVYVSSYHGMLERIPNECIRKELSDVDSLTVERLDEIVQMFLNDFKEGLLEIHGWPTNLHAYRVSKAALNTYARILAKRYPTFCINCVHPGAVKTDMNPIDGVLTPEEGARGPAMLALVPDGGPTGLFFDQIEVSTF
ncbi:short-chain dehydrogenase/reductase 1-like [Tasmannia lanceolata]|uniref:short-chain dehydrogenase/reductase 1-like n=1 Tax=Tasmannia lanceolata TaxID=3420 RepID=UPI004063610A